jgi:hypothetical protein
MFIEHSEKWYQSAQTKSALGGLDVLVRLVLLWVED